MIVVLGPCVLPRTLSRLGWGHETVAPVLDGTFKRNRHHLMRAREKLESETSKEEDDPPTHTRYTGSLNYWHAYIGMSLHLTQLYTSLEVSEYSNLNKSSTFTNTKQNEMVKTLNQ